MWAAVESYCRAHGVTVAREFVEVESGRNDSRAVLREAIALAKRTRAKLLIAKLDRLARSVSFVSSLIDSDVEFAACDLPEANRLLLHVMAAVGEAEARAISDRTIAALGAAKARGTALGATNPRSRNLTPEARRKGAASAGRRVQENAGAFYADVRPVVKALHDEGLSLRQIAARLDADGYPTRRGGGWTAVQVARLLGRE